ncbi:hypothetical protein BZA70DRAFT_281100 [Myxozyma melibiosi]|uniref:Uncharacterized protein n=1 Tax=Myxozyma melibiosi TaxID=54550 RepID=A0ABR1F3W6_9ASCO
MQYNNTIQYSTEDMTVQKAARSKKQEAARVWYFSVLKRCQTIAAAAIVFDILFIVCSIMCSFVYLEYSKYSAVVSSRCSKSQFPHFFLLFSLFSSFSLHFLLSAVGRCPLST